MNILIVDDTEFNLLIAKKFILHSIKDAEVETCYDGEQALEKSLQKKYSLILMDIQMPVMDGATAIQMIRKNEENPNYKTPIIALSASVNTDWNCPGVNDFIAKPLELPTLIRKIEQYREAVSS